MNSQVTDDSAKIFTAHALSLMSKTVKGRGYVTTEFKAIPDLEVEGEGFSVVWWMLAKVASASAADGKFALLLISSSGTHIITQEGTSTWVDETFQVSTTVSRFHAACANLLAASSKKKA